MSEETRLYEILAMKDVPTQTGNPMWILNLEDAETKDQYNEVKWWPPKIDGFSFDEVWNNGEPSLIEGAVEESFYKGKSQVVFNTKEQLASGNNKKKAPAKKASPSPAKRAPMQTSTLVTPPKQSQKEKAVGFFSQNPTQWMEATKSKNALDCIMVIESLLEE